MLLRRTGGAARWALGRPALAPRVGLSGGPALACTRAGLHVAAGRGLTADSGGGFDADAAAAAAAPGHVGDTVRIGLEAVQATTGLPWWATLACCGAGLRLGLLPLSKVQETHIGRLQTVVPALRKHLRGGGGGGGGEDGEGGGGGRDWGAVRTALKSAKCSPLLVVGPPLLQIASFVSLTVGVRALALHSSGEVHEALSTGGTLWFENLTVPDELWALPVMHVTVVLLNLELGLGKITQPPPGQPVAGADPDAPAVPAPGDAMRRVVGGLHTGLNVTMLTMFPLISELPAAVFVTWLSTSSSSLAYQLFIKPYTARSPPQPPQPPVPAAAAAAAAAPAGPGQGKQFKKSETKLPDQLSRDMRRVKELMANTSWAVAPPTPTLVKKLQKLLDAERKNGTIRTPLVVVLEKDALDPKRNSIGIKLLR